MSLGWLPCAHIYGQQPLILFPLGLNSWIMKWLFWVRYSRSYCVCVCVLLYLHYENQMYLWEPNVRMKLLSDKENPPQSGNFTELHACNKLSDNQGWGWVTGNECCLCACACLHMCVWWRLISVHSQINTINCMWNLLNALRTSPHTPTPTLFLLSLACLVLVFSPSCFSFCFVVICLFLWIVFTVIFLN